MSDHWLIRLNGDSKRGSMVSRSSTTCPSSIPDSPETPVFQNKPSIQEKVSLDGFESRPLVQGAQRRSESLRTPTKTRVLPLRWSFGNKDRHKPAPAAVLAPAELVEYLESGRRPRSTKDPIVALLTRPSDEGLKEDDIKKPAARTLSHTRFGNPGHHKIPQGKERNSSEKAVGHQLSSNNRPREDNTLDKSNSRKIKPHHTQFTKSFCAGIQSSSSSQSGCVAMHKDVKCYPGEQQNQTEEKQRKWQDTKYHDSVFSFLKSGFMKKDPLQRSQDASLKKYEDLTKSLTGASLLNGAQSGTSEGKANSINQGCNIQDGEFVNGKVRHGLAYISHSQSSFSIQNNAELSLRRTASLHRNGTLTAQLQNIAGDRGSQNTLQRTRYSTNSLGRKKTVPESSF